MKYRLCSKEKQKKILKSWMTDDVDVSLKHTQYSGEEHKRKEGS